MSVTFFFKSDKITSAPLAIASRRLSNARTLSRWCNFLQPAICGLFAFNVR